MNALARLFAKVRNDPDFVIRGPLRWIGIAGFLWMTGSWLMDWASTPFHDRACVSTVVEQIQLPNPHRRVEATIYRCETARDERPQMQWEAWALSTEPDMMPRRSLIRLEYREDAPPRLRLDDAGKLLIDRFRFADVLDWERGRGEGIVPTDFLFIDDDGVERALP